MTFVHDDPEFADLLRIVAANRGLGTTDDGRRGRKLRRVHAGHEDAEGMNWFRELDARVPKS